MIRRVGVLTGGGDCPGLNNAIKWVVKAAHEANQETHRGERWEVVGIRDGWAGLVKFNPRHPVLPPGRDFGPDDYARVLAETDVRTWDRMGGTRLGSSRTNPFKKGKETWEEVVRNLQALELHALVAIGGDDTASVAWRLWEKGINIVTIPKTIDRDLKGTDYTLGFETAVNVIVEEIDRLRTTASSHGRTFVVETMGRHAGHLALAGGLATGADLVLIPEVPFEMERVAELLREHLRESRYAIVIAAEGAQEAGAGLVTRGQARYDQFGHVVLGGIGKVIETRLATLVGGEVRSVVLSHLQRGGAPCAFDRRMGRLFGIGAMDLVAAGDFGKMVAWRDGRVAAVPIPHAEDNVRPVDVEERYDVERYCGRLTVLQGNNAGRP
ncbi:MAG: ATP-dependent 6-phosphofructokinase [Deltaproteobacteria bacterium]|nr:ATP-dependent 6-phosphofructokinase [Deltaproteobacteria bacterium]